MLQRAKNFLQDFTSEVLSPAFGQFRYIWRFFVKPAVIRNRGIRLVARHPVISPYMRIILYRDRYERPELQILEKTLAPDDRVLELGGGVGFISTYSARKCGDESVTVVEANPALAPLIAENHRLNGVHPTVINAAATLDDRETETFYVTKDFWAGSTQAHEAERVTVPALNANALIADLDPTYLIIDIEGAETELVPALDFGNVKKLLIELHPHASGITAANEVIPQLFMKGFAIDMAYSIRNNFFMVRTDEHEIVERSLDAARIESSRSGAASNA